MYAIEAHEIAHYILNHDIKTPSKEQEKEADIVAIEILNYLNHQKAKDLLIRRFEGLYTSDYSLNNNLSKEDIKKVKTYLKRKKVSLLDKIKKIFRFNKK
jgi:Zn-dependent peptidase ImmA (M78 family)